MVHEFSPENIALISDVLGAKPRKNGEMYRFSIENISDNRKLVLEIYPSLRVDGHAYSMITVYAHNTFLQLQNCVGFVASELLHQVTFFGKTEGTTSGLIVEKEAACSFYANVEDSILKGDFTKLPSELMTSSIALSLTENIDLEGFTFEDE